MRLNSLVISKQFSFICILFCTTFQISICNGQHSSTYNKYQEAKAFKGIMFGTSYSETTKRLSLKPTNNQNEFEIKNIEYLEYDVLKFKSGYAYFTKSGKLYQIILKTSPSTPPYQKYNGIKQRLIYLFGPCDNEYTYDPKENFIQPLQISWGGKPGANLYIHVMVMAPSSGENTTVNLTILDNKLNAEAQKEIINSSEEGKVPKI